SMTGGLRSPLLAAQLLFTTLFVLLFPSPFAVVPPILTFPAVAKLDQLLGGRAVVQFDLFILLWYSAINCILVYLMVYLNERDRAPPRPAAAAPYRARDGRRRGAQPPGARDPRRAGRCAQQRGHPERVPPEHDRRQRGARQAHGLERVARHPAARHPQGAVRLARRGGGLDGRAPPLPAHDAGALRS